MRGPTLLGLARSSIAESFGGPKPGRPTDAPWLDLPGAVFVTLTQDGELRGVPREQECEQPPQPSHAMTVTVG